MPPVNLGVAFDELGVDILELGVPFSDPLADGLVNQLASQRGLASGTNPRKVLATVSEIRQRSRHPHRPLHLFQPDPSVRAWSVLSVKRPSRAWMVCWCWICHRKKAPVMKH